MIAVLVVAAYPSMRAGLRALLTGEPDIDVIGEWAGGEWQADVIAGGEQPDVVLWDVDPGSADELERHAGLFPDAAPVFLVERPDAYRGPEIDAGRALAVLLKDAEAGEIVATVRAVAAGLVVLDPAIAAQIIARPGVFPRAADDLDDRLTERELQVLQLLALGLPNKTIAVELGISEHTAKFHVGSIMTKLGAASRTEAVAQAARRGLLVL